MPPLEAMQCGTPVICSEADAIPEVVGEAGFLLPPTELGPWIAALRGVWENASLREDMSRRSVMRSRGFDWKMFTDNIQAGYRYAMKVSSPHDDVG